MRKLTLTICFLGWVFTAYAQPYITSVDVKVPFVPTTVIINGWPTIYYELHLTNYATDTLWLKSLKVTNRPASAALFSVSGKELNDRVLTIGSAKKQETNPLFPGATVVVFVELVLPKQENNNRLANTFELEHISKNKRESFLVRSTTPEMVRPGGIIVGPPLRSGPWVGIYDPAWQRGHRRVFYTVDGQARLPGRFAIDFIKLDKNGKYATGDENLVKNWYGYENEVLAVSDGVVASVKDAYPESKTISGLPDLPVGNEAGNYVSIKIGGHLFAFYEHLTPGSIKVKPGQRVKKGQVIAALGFTGHTTGPHLHFHLANADSPLGGEGVPFAFEKFILLGGYKDLSNFGKVTWVPGPINLVKKERPAPNTVIRF